MARRTARGNRWGLALLGSASAALGGAGMAAGYGLWGPGPDGRVLPARLAGAAGPWAPYLPYAGAALALLVALAALRWILVQARTGAVARAGLEDAGEGEIVVSASALQDAVRGRAGGYPGVRSVRLRAAGPADAPRLWIDMALDDDADPAELCRRLRAEVLPELRDALGADRLPAVLRLVPARPPLAPGRGRGLA
ncbi:alkaline shock response membrane anchor protein AmaP [Nocardiopsis sp. CNT-189]